MFRRKPNLLLLVITLIFAIIPWKIEAQNHSSPSFCERTCRNSKLGSDSLTLPYPFGFSDGCEIKLNCNTTGKAAVGEFPVELVTGDSIKVSIQRRCNRSLRTVGQLFGPNYAPTSRNALLLENCTGTASPCEIPSILVQTHFSSPSCSDSNATISCYSEGNNRAFIDYNRLMKERKCDYLLSSISAESLNASETPVSLAVEVVELGWWLEGRSCQCDVNANCTNLVSPNGKKGYRCNCKEGFEGDGYTAGLGCRKAFSKCNPARYISGKCGGLSRVVLLVGGIVVVASLTISLVLIMCCCYRRRSKWKVRRVTKRRLSEATGNLNIPIYSYRDIEKATNGFSDKYRLGTGAYGTVYAGKLTNCDEWVAIKRIRYRDADSIEQVVNEIKLISSISHPNLIHLLGCSIDYREQILVYEFMPNGTLCQHLQKERGDGLSWLIRLTIATETAQAIAYLHSAIKPPIYHRDIKSSNILLDHNFRSKVADFGLSRLGMVETSHISTAPQGTPGYLDPQYYQNFHLSDKSDVYSFGVVLVEIITGLKAVDFSRPQNEVNLAALATDRIGKGCLDEIIDPLIAPHRDAWTLCSVHKVAELAFRCLAFHRDMRPSMIEVAAELDQIRRSRSWGNSEDNTCTPSSEVCSSSSSSNVSERPLNFHKVELGRREILMVQIGGDSFNSKDVLKEHSPISVQDAWLSEHSSPSSNGLLRNSCRLST